MARVLLNRPARRNALDREAVRSLVTALEDIARRDDLAVAVLEGAGDHFCAGWDLSEFGRLAAAEDPEVASYLAANVGLLRRWADLPQFTVALVQGYAIGFGAALAVSADLAVADPSARLHFPEAEFGLVPAVVLPALVESLGVRAALRQVLAAAPVRAERAQAMGMVGMVAGEEQRHRLVERLAQLSPGLVRATKGLAAALVGASPAEIDRMVAEAGVATLRSEEARRNLGAG